jgi:hypothetical protein
MKCIAALLGLLACVANLQAATPDDRAKEAAARVKEMYGTEGNLTTNGIEPFGSERLMRTVEGLGFGAAMSCEASQQFLRVTMVPAGTEIGRVIVEMDQDLDGTSDRTLGFSGPFTGVCSNGVIRCTPSTWDNCQYLQWQASEETLALVEVTPRELGACYCFNAACGNNLLVVNSEKVVSDVGSGVLAAAQAVLPRVATTRTVADALSIQFSGQRAGCGIDGSPEQYFKRAQDLAAAGTAEKNRPGTVANFISNTAVARERGTAALRCELNRRIGTVEIRKNDILRFQSATHGSVQDCGAGCLRLLVGQVGDDYYDGGSCKVFEEELRLQVLRPERIASVTLTRIGWDDQVQLLVDGTRLYNSYPLWEDGAFPYNPRAGLRCEWGDENERTPNQNLTASFSRVGTSSVRLRTAVGGEGQGYAFLEARLNEACELAPEEIIDGCTGATANPRCRLRNEWVDGVQTVREFFTTGLGPLPSERTVGTSCGVNTGTRPWWRTEREYDCQTEVQQFDLSADAERYRSIHHSINLGTGEFTDRRQSANGSIETVPSRIPVLAERGANACTPTCRTRRLRPGSNVGITGPTTAQNNTGVAYDFNFKDCESGACPVEPGEEVVGACDCHNNFSQAAAMMQTIRMVAEDTSCEVP